MSTGRGYMGRDKVVRMLSSQFATGYIVTEIGVVRNHSGDACDRARRLGVPRVGLIHLFYGTRCEQI